MVEVTDIEIAIEVIEVLGKQVKEMMMMMDKDQTWTIRMNGTTVKLPNLVTIVKIAVTITAGHDDPPNIIITRQVQKSSLPQVYSPESPVRLVSVKERKRS